MTPDQLKFDGTDQNSSGDAFYKITQKVNGGQAGATQRIEAYRLMQKLSTENGNSYESIVGAMNRLGLSAIGADGYKDRFGLGLRARAPFLPPQLLQADALALSASNEQLINLAQAMELSIEEIAMVADMPAYDSGASVIYVAEKAQASQPATRTLTAASSAIMSMTT